MEFAKLNTLTKYPSIPTFHVLGDKGKMPGEHVHGFDGSDIVVTEKVDGTNARIIWMGGGDFFVGSREHLLHARGDRCFDPSNGIVETLLSLGVLDRLPVQLDPCVIYGEVYGGKINGAKEYTSTQAVGFRVFDVAHLDLAAASTRSIPEVAAWRDNTGPAWWGLHAVESMCGVVGIDCVPVLPALEPLPSGVAEASAWLKRHVGHNTLVALDGPPGQMEGVVVRTRDNKRRVKLRTEDYRRALRGSGGG